AVSSSASVLARTTCSSRPRLFAAGSRCRDSGSAKAGLVGLTSTAMRRADGTTSCSNCSCLGPSSTFRLLAPVRLPPGRRRPGPPPRPPGIAPAVDPDRYRRRRHLGRQCRRRAGGDDDAHLPARQVGRTRRQRLVSAIPAVLDRDIAAIVEAGLAQALAER